MQVGIVGNGMAHLVKFIDSCNQIGTAVYRTAH
jgi:hypothetical protein